MGYQRRMLVSQFTSVLSDTAAVQTNSNARIFDPGSAQRYSGTQGQRVKLSRESHACKRVNAATVHDGTICWITSTKFRMLRTCVHADAHGCTMSERASCSHGCKNKRTHPLTMSRMPPSPSAIDGTNETSPLCTCRAAQECSSFTRTLGRAQELTTTCSVSSASCCLSAPV